MREPDQLPKYTKMGIFGLIVPVLWAKLSLSGMPLIFGRSCTVRNLSRSYFKIAARFFLQHRDSIGRMPQSEVNLLSDGKVVGAHNCELPSSSHEASSLCETR